MKSAVFITICAFVALLAAPAASHAAPVVQLSPTDPGINVVYPFSGPDEFGNTDYLLPTQWGGLNANAGNILSGDDRLTFDTLNGFVRYNTTMQGQNPAKTMYTTTAMDTAQDWVMSFDWESNMTATNGTVFELSHATNDVARLVFSPQGVTGQLQLFGGNGGSGYAVIETFAPNTVLLPNMVNTLTLHYKASSQLLDFYINGNLEAENFPARGTSPGYGVNFIQLGGGREVDEGNPDPVDFFQNVKIGLLAATATPGDFDSDGDVDGADFVVWQTNFPTASDAMLDDGDADGDGDVDGADFVVWQTNFPTSPGAGASPVPEPAAWMLCSLAIPVLARASHRRIARK